ncbi:MarR family winged helix-turn-helix transcriptional regulator [Corynebacterium freiburgense]|uniref:MarR family winged helix-turn-helix transcriptional regulator n=1 Tax=Corynebacterium freiburgense TaxID=556548 RepID=UPI000423FB4C|nr:MarR family transcriptional regulator [Corynebacterium freiburgense]WJZ03699.1 DNA-binding transcriptional repressor MarR [Corynebacterium freiburgense]
MGSAALDIPADLLESPSFQLERLRRRTRDRIESVLSHENISLRGYWVLTCLTSSNASSQSTLCSILTMDASDMVRLIDVLEKHGWAKRSRDPKDRRRQIVSATKKGRAAQKRLSILVSQAEDTALEESTPKQLKHLRKLAQAIFAAEEV